MTKLIVAITGLLVAVGTLVGTISRLSGRTLQWEWSLTIGRFNWD